MCVCVCGSVGGRMVGWNMGCEEMVGGRVCVFVYVHFRSHTQLSRIMLCA